VARLGRPPKIKFSPKPKRKRESKKVRHKKAVRAQELAAERRHNGGRPTSYDPQFAEDAAKLAALGATDQEIADFFHITVVTVWHWQSRHQEFFNALRRNKDAADERVERSLYSRATGFSFLGEEVKINADGTVRRAVKREYVPPSEGAINMWLSNRKPNDWKIRRTNEFDPEKPLNIKVTGGLPKES
jgi:hypothetical protein